jgi:branched-chain amino acid transport system ATP-binding protein
VLGFLPTLSVDHPKEIARIMVPGPAKIGREFIEGLEGWGEIAGYFVGSRKLGMLHMSDPDGLPMSAVTRADDPGLGYHPCNQMLDIKEISVYYGAIQALNNVTINVQKNEIVAIIGSNGAGKSTLLRTISGLLKPRTGQITFEGQEIHQTPADQIVKLGVSHSPEGRKIFTNMTVHENLQLGAFIRKDADIGKDMEAVMERFPRLRERFKQNAGTLSGGEQQMLAIGRAMISRPKILLLDEPSLGLAPNLVAQIFQIVLDLNKDGTTILIVEQNANRALEIAHRAYVLETGNIVLADTGAALLANPKVKEAYLGG